MERPESSKISPEALEYIEDLEERLELFTSGSTIALFYVGLKKQVNDISELFITLTMDEKALKSKDDKFIDILLKYLEKSKVLVENLVYVEKMVAPEKIIEAKMRADAFLEQYLKDNPDTAE